MFRLGRICINLRGRDLAILKCPRESTDAASKFSLCPYVSQMMNFVIRFEIVGHSTL